LVAITTRSAQTFALPSDAQAPLVLALLAFTAASLVAIFTNLPWTAREADPEGLRQVLDTEAWTAGETEALRAVSANRLTVLTSQITVSSRKGWVLVLAMTCEVVAVGFLAWAMLEIVYR
jgi:hypothetical protein